MSTLSVTAALLQWIGHRGRMAELNLVAPSTLANQKQIVGTLVGGLGSHDLENLRKSVIELYVGERLQTCQPVTVTGELNVLRQFLNWCMDEGLLTKKPRLPTVSVPATEAPLPGDEAFAWMLAAVPANISRALEFMMLTGLSPHELERVQVRDMEWFQTQPQLGIGQRPDFALKQPSRRRRVPLNERALAIWFQDAEGGAQTDEVFPTSAAMQKAMVRARKVPDPQPAGVEGVTPKTMRKWFASKVSDSEPEHVLQRLLGHAPGSKITRKHYVRSTDEALVDAVCSLSLGGE